MPVTVTYLFDPLCGWCYGASPIIAQLATQTDCQLKLAPTGLFAGTGRMLDASFAEYAWSNDVRIEKLTGQRFTEAYRANVLGQSGKSFDSAAATLALTAVSLVEPQRELQALVALQEARYLHGLDTCEDCVVETLLRDLGFVAAASLFAARDAELLAADAARVSKAQTIMRALEAQGVPALVISDGKGSRLLRGNAMYGTLEQLRSQIFGT